LPILQAARPARAASASPRRLIIVIQTNGLPSGMWRSVGTASDLGQTPLPEPLGPLEPYKSLLNVFPELANPAYTGAGHGAYGTTFSGGPNNPSGEYWTPQQATLDQVCADAVAKSSSVPLATLPLQLLADKESRLGAYRCFFRGNNQPITPEPSPYKVADRLFAGRAMGDPAADKLRAERRSILDYVKADLDRYAKNLGTEDRQSIAAHLQSMRDIERQLAGVTTPGAACTTPNLGQPLDFNANDNYPTMLGLQLDLAVAALRCDATRVVTLQLANAYGGNLMFTWLGLMGKGLEYPLRTWHDVAHREVNAGTNDKVQLDRWFMTQFAGLLGRLKNAPEGAGSMLDSTMVLWANHMEAGGNHNAMKLPWILAGSGGGYFKTGQLRRGTPQIAKTRVMCEIANAMGANLPFFGAPDYGAPMPELRA
jgi:hypothetical protein